MTVRSTCRKSIVSLDLFSTTRLGTQVPNSMVSSPRRTSMPLAANADAASTPVIPSTDSVPASARAIARVLLGRQPLLAARRQHLQDRGRGLLDRAAGDVDGRPLALRIEPPRLLDLA